jgi:hypothetical protein
MLIQSTQNVQRCKSDYSLPVTTLAIVVSSTFISSTAVIIVIINTDARSNRPIIIIISGRLLTYTNVRIVVIINILAIHRFVLHTL